MVVHSIDSADLSVDGVNIYFTIFFACVDMFWLYVACGCVSNSRLTPCAVADEPETGCALAATLGVNSIASGAYRNSKRRIRRIRARAVVMRTKIVVQLVTAPNVGVDRDMFGEVLQ